MRILLWPMHGSYADALVRGDHEYLLPSTPEGGTFSPGRAGYDSRWPASAIDVHPDDLRHAQVDLVILQRLEEFDYVRRWLGRRPGVDVPAVFVEHNVPRQTPWASVHPLAEQSSIPIVHVTHFNRLLWDNGRAPNLVIEHGVVDPGYLYTGELPHLGVAINEPVRRGRIVGADLLPDFADAGHIDHFGIDGHLLADAVGLGADKLTHVGDVPMTRLHAELARRRVYVHPLRWTSLGLALLEAMHLGMPVVALDTTEASRAVPPEAGAISANVDELVAAAARLLADPDEARERGRFARKTAIERYGLARFLADWDALIQEVAGSSAAA